MLADSAARWEAADVIDRGLLANRAKYLATEVALQVTSRVIQVVGGRGAYKDYPAERAFRDVRTATLMPPTVDRTLEAFGERALGFEAAMFNPVRWAGLDRAARRRHSLPRGYPR